MEGVIVGSYCNPIPHPEDFDFLGQEDFDKLEIGAWDQ
jgi:hypothetical protein